ncbi:MAG: glycosyltransferase family 4 protein, partial [Nitrososphaeria archaeon]
KLSKKIKCLIITFVSVTKFISKEKYYELINQIKDIERNHKIKIILLPFLTDIYTIYILGPFFSLILSFYFTLIEKILRKKYMVYIRLSPLAFGFLINPLFSQRTFVKIPSIIEEDVLNNVSKKILRIFSILYDKIALVKAEYIVSHSPLLYKHLLLRCKVERVHNVLIIPPSIDLKVFNQLQLINKNSNSNQVCFIGSLAWWQGVDIIVLALYILKHKGINLKLRIIGDGPFRKVIEKLCQKYGIECEITGFVSRARALRLLSECSALVLPRRKTLTTESVVPIKVVEAMSLGVPVIITNHEVLSIYGLRDGYNVLTCEPKPKSVAESIFKLISSEQLKNKIKVNGKELAKKFDSSLTSKKIYKIIIQNEDF